MWHFQRIDPLQQILPVKFIAFVGAGGKTSFIEYLADRLIRTGKTVAITTTTKIYARKPYHVLINNGSPTKRSMPLVRVGKTLENGKLTAIDPLDIERLGAEYDTVLIEADGAKSKPLKFPAPYEPVIPSAAEKIYVVSGLDAIFHKVRDVVFRWELLHDSVGIDGETIVTPDVFMSFFSASILFKDVDMKKCVVVFNKYDTLKQKSCGTDVARALCSNVAGLNVTISSINLRTFYNISH
jgi:probable selenium-dependent hydroxylase accessory protein YqeC